MILNPGRTFSFDQTFANKVSNTIIAPVSAVVEDYKPPTWGQTGSGSGLKSTRIIVQKYSFIELYLNFEDCKVIDGLGLPDGMSIENSFLKGTPRMSGKYPVILKLSNERILDVLIIVPEVPRQL
ncbi:hypothetical protein D3C71_1696290 [compost metagenome]